jgi:acyl carrier protein
MLARSLRAIVPRRSYGWEDPKDEWTKNYWHRADGTNFSDQTLEDQGFTRDSEDLKKDKHWREPLPYATRLPEGQYGLNTSDILNIELNDNPLGPYDRLDETLHTGEIRTRMIHVLRHFSEVDLRQLDWHARIVEDLKLDSLDRIALLTSVETEFKTIFEDNLFDSMHTLHDVVRHLKADSSLFSS